jgi:Predicted membrane protein
MKKIIFSLLLISYLLFGGEVWAEEIKNFKVDIVINKDGTIDVKETIVYDFDRLYRHGIHREIPFIKTNKEGKKFKLDFYNFSVVDEGKNPYRFQKILADEKIRLKIGDADKTVSGIRTYIISYKVAGALTYFSDHDELYWNAVGNDWPVSIKEAVVEVELPEKIDESQLKTACYTGSYGATTSLCEIAFNHLARGRQKLVIKTTSILGYKEGLTFVLGFPKNIVSVLEPKEHMPFWETILGKIILFLFGLAILFWYLILPFYIAYLWFKYGRDPKGDVGVTSAWFDPPKTPDGKRFLTPAEVGVLGDETVDLKDVSSTIVDLARRGYLRIEERKKGEFWLVKNLSKTQEILKQVQDDSKSKNPKLINDELLPFEKILLDKFFKGKTEINLKKEELYQEVEEVKKAIYEQVVATDLFPENPEKIRTLYYILLALSIFTANFLLFFSSLIFGLRMPRKTKAGVEAKNIAFSLRNFLKSQERQLKFQADKQLLFERLLPYAIVFGVEKNWAKRFEDLGINQPSWYQSYSSSWSFNSVYFVNSLNSSILSFKQAATSTTSSSGFSSGFSSGGGFSGGGGGGGGGGSW